MNNAISRRTFLKCAGTAAVAVGAASMLGGCSLIDNIINNATKDVPNMITLGNVNFILTAPFTYTVPKTEGSEKKTVKAVIPFIVATDIGQVVGNSGVKELSKDNFKLTIDGVDAQIKIGKEATALKDAAFANYSDKDEDYVMLLDDNGKVKVLKDQEIGGLIFVPGQEISSWKKAVLTISYKGQKGTFTMTYKGEWDADIVKG